MTIIYIYIPKKIIRMITPNNFTIQLTLPAWADLFGPHVSAVFLAFAARPYQGKWTF